MQIKNEIKHEIRVENERGESVLLTIDMSDPIKVAQLGRVLESFDNIRKFELPQSDDFYVMLRSAEELGNKFYEAQKLLNLAFDENVSEKIFLGSNSIFVYEQFFIQLEAEIEKAGKKAEAHVKKRRKEALLNDHKDTL